MESRTPWTLEERRKLDKAILTSVDWAAVAESLPGRTVAEVEAQFDELRHDRFKFQNIGRSKPLNIDLGKGKAVLTTDEQQPRLWTKYQRMESGNPGLVRCKNKTSPACSFMGVVTDDLLQEIFLRLPSGASLIRSTTVCKRWHSLVNKNPSFSDFLARFIHHHANKEPSSEDPTYISALFKFSVAITKIGIQEPFYELRLSTCLTKTFDLRLIPKIPNPECLTIRASCGDLLLLSFDDCQYYICNSVTRDCFELPVIPDALLEDLPDLYSEEGGYAFRGYALVCHNPIRYSVVIVANSDMNDIGECRFYLVLFDSKAGTWTQTLISLRYRVHPRLISCKKLSSGIHVVCTRRGVVHWLEGTRQRIYAVASFDPLSFKSRLIPLPCAGLHVSDMEDSVRLGVVQGRLRLFLTAKMNEFRFCVQIWELDDAKWTLVHDLLLNIEDEGINVLFFVLCLDPYDGNVIYLVRGKRISRYEIGQTEDVGICEFPCHGKSIDELRRLVARHLEVFTLVHPPWPTQISSSQSSTYQS